MLGFQERSAIPFRVFPVTEISYKVINFLEDDKRVFIILSVIKSM